ncbi:MFS general substrate transporter [Microthyrium microscopicum]|uniref:MFS general substrate transporter n=1 Tax=Microthyrium microscopicum TaxID=703497 RepID=A0A6A6TYU3_9PEZI|nr:MFS general substrate transporter [Microthyrium microscopicum]
MAEVNGRTLEPPYRGLSVIGDGNKARATQLEHASSSDSNGVQEDSNGIGGISRAKWLAIIALCLSYTTTVQQNACTAAIVKHIDAELGPTNYYNWILSAYSISVSVALPLAGGLSDIFGRKPFFLVGTLIALVGTVVALAAQNVPMIIAAMVLKGIGAGSQQLALAAIGELVENRQRGNAQAALDIVTLPWSIFGPLTGNAMVKYQKLSFRINFIVGIGLNVLTLVAIQFWYHPPPARLVPGVTKKQRLAALDWIGVLFMAFGIVLTLMGLAFGGVQFPWSSPGTIAPVVLGIMSLIALGIWEWKFAKEPFFAHELFIGKARTFTILLLLTFVGGMSLYTAAAFWTQQCQYMFFRDPIKIGVSAIPGGVGGAIGGFLGGILIGKGPGLGSNNILIYSSAMKLVSDIVFTTLTPYKFQLALGMGFLAMFGMGFSLVALIVCVQLASEDHHLGLATLVLGSIRAIGGSVAVTIYSSILMNTIQEDAGRRVGNRVIPMGAPRSSLPKLIPLLTAGKDSAALKLPEITQDIVDAGNEALKWTGTLAFRRIYYSACAFSALALVASFFVKDISHKMTDNVAIRLTNEKGTAREVRKGESGNSTSFR